MENTCNFHPTSSSSFLYIAPSINSFLSLTTNAPPSLSD